MNRPTCSTCCYFKGDNVHDGECRHKPPTHDGYPAAKATEWCGRHQDFPRYIEHINSFEGQPRIEASSGDEPSGNSGY